MTDKQKKFLNSADKKIRGARKDIDIIIKEEINNKMVQPTDSDELMDVQES